MKGIISALVVPFTENYEVDYEKLKNIVEYNITKSKVDGLYVNGSTGENFTINTATKKAIFKCVAQANANRVDLIAQIGSINLNEAIELGKYVKSLGSYKAISAVTPFYYKFSFTEIKQYYNKITSEVAMDMIIYSIPQLTGVAITLEQFGELFTNEQIIGVKFTANDFYTMEQIKTKYPNKLLYSGFDEMLLSAAVVGIDGAIGSTYNYQAYLAKDVLAAVNNNNLELALKSQRLMNQTISILLKAGLYQTIKAVLTADNCNAGICNLPFSKTTAEQNQAAQEILKILKQQ